LQLRGGSGVKTSQAAIAASATIAPAMKKWRRFIGERSENKFPGFSPDRVAQFALRSVSSCRLEIWERREKPNKQGLFWWTHKGSNLGPLPCEGNALPLSYASGISCMIKGR
jgi:hypothetical protein